MSIEVLLPLLAVLILSLSFHEAAHAWMADRLGDATARQLGRLTMNPVAHVDVIGTIVFPIVAIVSNFPLIGWAKPVPVDMRNLKSPRRDFGLVALAGPVSNLILAVGFAIVLAVVPLEAGTMPWLLARYSVQMNVLLAFFNLLPIPPLDGGNVLAGVLPESGARLIDTLRSYGFLIVYGLLFAGVLDWLIFEPAWEVASWLM